MNEVPIPERLRWQAGWCVQLGSPLYGDLLERAAADFEDGGPCAGLLAGHESDSLGSALPLRFMGAIHRLVLSGRAPELAAFFPSAGGDRDGAEERWLAFVATLEHHAEELPALIESPVQTNEVGRAAALVGGFMLVAAEAGLPLRLLEVGTSAGLNLRFDRYRYDWGEVVLGDAASPVRFEQPFDRGRCAGIRDPRGRRSAVAATAARAMPPRPEDRLTLLSYVWPDQLDRIERLQAAFEIGARVPNGRSPTQMPASGRPRSCRSRRRAPRLCCSTPSCSPYLSEDELGTAGVGHPTCRRPRNTERRRSHGCGWSPRTTSPTSG